MTRVARDPRYAAEGTPESIGLAYRLGVGDRVRFAGEKQARFKVVACGARFRILKKPFNLHPRAKSLYTVIDLDLGIRGTHDSYGHGVEDTTAIARTLAALEAHQIEISVRNNVRLDIADVKPATPKPHQGGSDEK